MSHAVRLTPVEKLVFAAISRDEGLPTRNARELCANVESLKIHIFNLRKKGIPVLSVRQKIIIAKRGGRAPVTYFLDKSAPCPTVA